MTRLSEKLSSDSDLSAQLSAGEIRIWLVASAALDSDTLSRRLLSRFVGLAPGKLEIERGEQGKPRLVNGPAALHFSLSHSGDWTVFALSQGPQIGVDIEVYDSRRDCMRLARRFFGEAETRALESLQGASRLEYFYQLWTLKEARIKALGAGLGGELETTSFCIETSGGLPVISARPVTGEMFFGLLSPLDGYSLALCALSPTLVPPPLSVFSLSETGEERVLPIKFQACSSG